MLGPTLPRRLFRGALTIGTGLTASYYLLWNGGDLALGVFAACWFTVLVSTAGLRAVAHALAQHQAAIDCNVRIRLWIDVYSVLKSDPVRALFERLKALDRVHVSTVDEWINGLAQRFQYRLGKSAPLEEVVFHVCGNHVWKDEKPWFGAGAGMYHEVLVPDDAMRFRVGRYVSDGYRGLKIRLVVVNGILKLQIGQFDETDTVELLREGSEWRSWQTVTTFPLLYCPTEHYLPTRLLNLDYPAPEEHRSKRQGNTMKEYCRKLSDDTARYEHILTTRSDALEPRSMRIYADFSKRLRDWIEREQFRHSEESPYFANLYLGVEINNLGDFKWHRALSDFDQPTIA